ARLPGAANPCLASAFPPRGRNPPMTCPQYTFVDAHFAGTIGAPDERSMRAHLLDCENCRAHYRRHLVFARLDPDSLGQEERIARGLGLRSRRRPRTPLVPVALSMLAVAAALFLFLRPVPRSEGAGFAPRGSISSASTLLTPSRISVYRIPSSGRESPTLAS